MTLLGHRPAVTGPSPHVAPLRIALTGSGELVRQGLVALVERQRDHGRTCVVVDLPDAAAPSEVDVVLVDAGAWGVRAADQVHHLVVAGFDPVLALGWDAGRRDELLAAGAREHLSLRLPAADLVRAVVEAAQTASPAGPHRCPPDPPVGVAFEVAGCSRREAEVVTLICRGLTNDEVARELYVSINTVKTYVRSAYRKLGVTSRSRAVLWGVRHGVAIPADDPAAGHRPPPRVSSASA